MLDDKLEETERSLEDARKNVKAAHGIACRDHPIAGIVLTDVLVSTVEALRRLRELRAVLGAGRRAC